MMRVLVSTTEKNLGIVLRRELEDAGCRVDLISDGVDLTARSTGASVYDIILLDMMTSCLDDLTVLRNIKKERPGAHLIVFSDRVAAEEKNCLLHAGADVFFARHELQKLKNHLLYRQVDTYHKRLMRLFVDNSEDENREG